PPCPPAPPAPTLGARLTDAGMRPRRDERPRSPSSSGYDTSLLEDHPDPVSKVLASFLRIEPQDRDIPAVSSPVSLEDLHQRGLSCSVRPEEPEYLAATDR